MRVLFLVVIVAVASNAIPLSLAPVDGGIPHEHDLPAPYHTTDEILKYIQDLENSCGQKGNFRLEFRSSNQPMDLEMGDKPVPHGKSDEYFDFVKHSQRMLQVDPPTLNQGLPQSWHNKLTPPTELPVVHISTGGQEKRKAMVMFGEHGRELISCEIGMDFLKAVHAASCNKHTDIPSAQNLLEITEDDYNNRQPYSESQIHQLLSQWDLVIMPVVSPSARELAERKDFCNRKNSNGVDVNRNYPFHFGEGKHDKSSDQFPGDRPLTEPETKVAAALAREYKPKLFIAVHSGAEMIVTSPAYRNVRLDEMPLGVQKVVKSVQSDDCPECATGPASQVLNYLAYGCSMDFMFEEGFSSDPNPTKPNNEHFSFTFETWAGDKHPLADRHSKGATMVQVNLERDLGVEGAKEAVKQDERFKALKAQVGDRQFECLSRFNPPPTKFQATKQRWTKALFSTMHGVASELDSANREQQQEQAPQQQQQQPVQQAVEPAKEFVVVQLTSDKPKVAPSKEDKLAAAMNTNVHLQTRRP